MFTSGGWASLGKESTCQCRRCGFNPWVGKIPWRSKCQLTPVFLPGKIPWTEEPGGLQSMGSQRVEHNLATKNNNWWMDVRSGEEDEGTSEVMKMSTS